MKNWLPYSLIVFTTFFWGTTFILVKETINIIPINFFLTLRFCFAFLLMTPLIVKRARYRNIVLWKQGSILGLFLFASYYFQTVGLFYTTPANAAFITSLSIVFIPIFSFIIFKNKIDKKSILAVIIATIGSVFMTLNLDTLVFNPGDLIILLTAISIAFHILFTEKFIEQDLVELLWIQFIIMAIFAFILNLFEEPPTIVWYSNDIVVFTLVVTVIFATIFAFAAQLYAQQQKVSATVIGILFTLEPLFALLIDIIVGILPSFQTFIGMGLIFISILLVTLKPNKEVINA